MDRQSADAHIRALYAGLCALWLLNIAFIFIISLLWHRSPQDVDITAADWSLAALETVLVVLTIVLALGAFAGFWLIRHSAVYAAREEARIEARRRVDEELPRLIEEGHRRPGTDAPTQPQVDDGLSAVEPPASAEELREDEA